MTEPTRTIADNQHADPQPAPPDALDAHLAVRMHQRRTLVLSGPLTDPHAGRFVQALLLLAAEDPRRDVRLLLHSPGGSEAAALAVADTIRVMPYDVVTVVLGSAHGAAQLPASAGTPGRRLALPRATLRTHEAGDLLTAAQAVARGILDAVVDGPDGLVDVPRPAGMGLTA